MKKIYILLLFVLWIGSNLNAQTILSGVQELTGQSYGYLIIESDANITFNGNVTAQDLTVNESGVMIVNGNLTVNQQGGGVDAIVSLIVHGTLIVTGDLVVSTNKDASTVVNTTGIVVVGGSYETTAGKKQTETETNSGGVYLSDPNQWDDGAGIPEGSGGDIGDLIDSGVIPDDLLDEFIDNYDGSGLPSSTWDGESDGDWDEISNWGTDEEVPTKGTNVTITTDGVKPTFCDSKVYNIWNLTLSADAELIIPEGSQVTVYGDITIGTNATLTVQNSNASPTSLIVYGDITGDIVFSWTFDPLHWFFIGHPISNPSMANYRAILTDESNPNNKYALYDYQDDGTFNNLASEVESYEFNQVAGSGERIRGYQLKVLNTTTISQTGTPNNEDSYSKQVVDGWQIIANPYPAYYQIPVASSDFEGTDKTIYVSDSDTNADKQFYTFNTDNGIDVPEGSAGNLTNGIIAPGQAFYINGTDNTQFITMRQTNVLHSTGVSLKSAPRASRENLLRIKLSNKHGLTDEAVIALFPDGDVNLNTQDSKQRMYSGTNYSYIYSMVEDTKTVINVLPESVDNYEQVLGVQTKAGEQELRISGIDALKADYEVVLEDKYTGALITMTNSTVYSFTAEEGECNDRFILQFNVPSKNDVVTAIGDDVSDAAEDVKIYTQNNSLLKVECDWQANDKEISIYTIEGSLVIRDHFEGSMYTKALTLNSGVYIVKVNTNQQSHQQKVFIK